MLPSRFSIVKTRLGLLLQLLLLTVVCKAQPVFNKPHGLYKDPIMLIITAGTPGSKIYYTTDGSEPTIASTLYQKPFLVNATTILRAAEFRADTLYSTVTTCSYIYPKTVLTQPGNPQGYPSKWGKYTGGSGTAPADYEMDPELTSDPVFAQKIVDGLYSLPILSLVTDKGNLFNAQADEKTGGIYIYTGAPVSGYPGRGWERPVSAELFGGSAEHDLQIDCALSIHGGTSRNPEKNPKHSFRLKFKSDYGPGKLHYLLFGEDGLGSYNSIIVRGMFNDSWIYQGTWRGESQYVKELWARLIQKKMGRPYADGIYVHLFLNGLYWGLYSISERINDDFCKTHFGGDKEDYDIIKVTEDSEGQRLEASDGDIAKWKEMVSLAEKAENNQYYFRLIGMNGAEPLLDVDNFIDYMLVNQYCGNEDWDYHNWTAFRNRAQADRGFQFLCWDAEIIFRNLDHNALDTYYRGCTTHIFRYLILNPVFRHRYIDRAYQLLVAEGGLLTPQPVVELWDSLYNDIALALYAESARWGDYRKDVHPYSSKGELYTPETHYLKQRNKLLAEYFPQRTAVFIQQLIDKGWYPRTQPPRFLINGEEDSQADTLRLDDVLTLSGGASILYTTDGSDPVSWMNSSSGTLTSSAVRYSSESNLLSALQDREGWVTIRAIVQSFQGWSPIVSRSFYLTKSTGIELVHSSSVKPSGAGGAESLGRTGIYDLSGRRVSLIPSPSPIGEGSRLQLPKGIYIKNGRKILVK